MRNRSIPRKTPKKGSDATVQFSYLRSELFENVDFPLITLYKGYHGELHACTAEGIPVKVPFLEVELLVSCVGCRNTPAYDLLHTADMSAYFISNQVGMLQVQEKTFQKFKQNGNVSPSDLGSIFYLLDSLEITLRDEALQSPYLGSIAAIYLEKVKVLQEEMTTFVKSDELKKRIGEELRAEGSYCTPVKDAAVIFGWLELNTLARVAAVAYGTDLGKGLGIVTDDSYTVGFITSRYASALLEGTEGLPFKVFEAAATLWQEADEEDLFADGKHLLEAAKLLSDC